MGCGHGETWCSVDRSHGSRCFHAHPLCGYSCRSGRERRRVAALQPNERSRKPEPPQNEIDRGGRGGSWNGPGGTATFLPISGQPLCCVSAGLSSGQDAKLALDQPAEFSKVNSVCQLCYNLSRYVALWGSARCTNDTWRLNLDKTVKM